MAFQGLPLLPFLLDEQYMMRSFQAAPIDDFAILYTVEPPHRADISRISRHCRAVWAMGDITAYGMSGFSMRWQAAALRPSIMLKLAG